MLEYRHDQSPNKQTQPFSYHDFTATDTIGVLNRPESRDTNLGYRSVHKMRELTLNRHNTIQHNPIGFLPSPFDFNTLSKYTPFILLIGFLLLAWLGLGVR